MPAIGGARGVVGSAKTGADVTTAGLLVPTVNVEQIIRLNSLDQMAPPAADLNLNGKRTTNISNPAWITDGARAYGSLLGLGVNSAGLNITTTSTTFAAVASPSPASVVIAVPTTQGTAYQWDWAWAVTAGTGAMRTGGATSGIAAITDYGNATMRVWAA